MSALLAALPDLRDAACVGKADLFERTVDEHRAAGRPSTEQLNAAREAALHICSTCPSLTRCRRWLVGLPPPQRPRGVTAGLIVTSSGLPLRTRTTASAPPAQQIHHDDHNGHGDREHRDDRDDHEHRDDHDNRAADEDQDDEHRRPDREVVKT